MSIDRILNAIKEMQNLVEDEKENLNNGEYLCLCNATQRVYNCANAIKMGETPNEDDMELNELSDLWESHFDNGSERAMMPIEGLIETIVMGCEAKRVCAAVRVLNRALVRSKPDDPADAEKLLRWKEELIAERAIRVCAEILEKVDDRVFHNENHDEHWLYSILCCEIVELFERLAEGDALYRTKMRRNGVLKGMKEYAKDNQHSEALQSFLVV